MNAPEPEKKDDASSEEHVEHQMTNWLDVNSKLQKLLAANLNRPGSAAITRKKTFKPLDLGNKEDDSLFDDKPEDSKEAEESKQEHTGA